MADLKRIILFRFHKDFDDARERVAILRHFNTGVQVYGLYGGPLEDAHQAEAELESVFDGFWAYPEAEDKNWKWMHTDIMTKQWFREVGKDIEFDYLYSYEYDLVTLAPLIEIYPKIKNGQIALAAAEPFNEKIEDRWYWTSDPKMKPRYEAFRNYMKEIFGIDRQRMICLGPGPLLSRDFIERFAATEDVDYVHEELTLPAYAEVFGIGIVNHGMHPGFFAYSDEDVYFNCADDKPVSWHMIQELVKSKRYRRAFHPVKEHVYLNNVVEMMTEIVND